MIRRWILFLLSIMITALSVGIFIKAGLGLSPISSISYTLSLVIPALTVGTWTAIYSFLQIVLQIVLRPRDIHWKEIFIQSVMTIIFSFFIDFFLELLVDFNPDTYIMRLASMLICLVVAGFGIYLGLIANITMLPMDALLVLIAQKLNKNYGVLRVISDISNVVVAGIVCVACLGELMGVREGTIIAALLQGNIVRIMMIKLKPLTNILLPETTTAGEQLQSDNFIITISHEFASGGHTIGKLLAQKLNVEYYDIEIIELVAKKSGYTEEYVRENNEQMYSSMLYSIAKFCSASDNIGEKGVGGNLFSAEAEVIREIAQTKSCVIIGRLANYVLKNHKNCINVFITADRSNRVDRLMQENSIGKDVAVSIIANMEVASRRHCQYFSDLEWGNSLSYDITIKSNKCGEEKTVAVLLEFINQFRREKK